MLKNLAIIMKKKIHQEKEYQNINFLIRTKALEGYRTCQIELNSPWCFYI